MHVEHCLPIVLPSFLICVILSCSDLYRDGLNRPVYLDAYNFNHSIILIGLIGASLLTFRLTRLQVEELLTLLSNIDHEKPIMKYGREEIYFEKQVYK
jgi:hypothetical protein